MRTAAKTMARNNASSTCSDIDPDEIMSMISNNLSLTAYWLSGVMTNRVPD